MLSIASAARKRLMPAAARSPRESCLTSVSCEDSISPMTRFLILLIGVLALPSMTGCKPTDPEAVCDHVARLQPGSTPDRARDYVRRCVTPMADARAAHPEAYRCWSKCVVEVTAWPDSARCDSCLKKEPEFDIFRYTKTLQRQEEARKAQSPEAPASASASASSSTPAPPSAAPPAPSASSADAQPGK
ncbi:MAG TPA: hypothetical protein PLI95_04105 [Polyangiaceae bacterium]|nr:hypothetical protein [Polyangiaceae bacterium]